MSDAERLAMCRRAMAVAERVDEKKLVLDVLNRNPSPEALAMALESLDTPGLKANAAAAAVAIGTKIARTHPEAVAQAMKTVLAAGPPAGQAARAQELLDKAAP